MALRFLWISSSFSSVRNYPTLSLQNPSQTSSSCPFFSSSSISNVSNISSSSNNKTRRRTSLLVCQVSSATEQKYSSSTSTIVEAPTTELENEPRTRLIAQNVPWTCTAEDIRNLFEKYGTVTDVELSMYNKIRNRGLAFITMGSEEEALAALSNLESYELEGRVLKVSFSKSKQKKKENSTVATVTVPKHSVFVGNLSWKAKSSDLREFFGSMNGNVLGAEVIYQTSPRRPTGYGFVSFGSEEEAKAAISAFQGKTLMGRQIRLALSRKSLKEESKDGNKSKAISTEMSGDGGQSDKGDDTATLGDA